MNLRRALIVAACLLPGAGTGIAAAQFQPPPQPQQEPPCVANFGKLRADAEKKAGAIKSASARRVPPREACQLFNVFLAAEAKMLKYAIDNSVWCGIPPQIIATLKQSHARTNEIRTKVCQVAAAPPPAAGPTLSDALNAPIIDSKDIKPGRGTFDTLTGTPLGNK